MNHVSRPPGRIDVRLKSVLHVTGLGLAAVIALSLGACRQAPPQPVEILPEDVCARCKMAISEPRYSSEFLTKDEAAYKFDDIACMLSGIRERQARGDVTAVFVVDYQTRRWVNAQDAFFVRSQSLKTPMGGGIVAFQDKSRADAAALQFHGEPLRFADINQ
jgi:copper chaperone NosL